MAKLLSLLHARVTAEKSGLLKCAPKFWIEVDERTRNTQSDPICLPMYPAARDMHGDVKYIIHSSLFQRGRDRLLHGFHRKIISEFAVVDLDRA